MLRKINAGKIVAWLMCAVFFMGSAVYATDTQEESVVIAYDEALEMILDEMLLLRDIEIAIRDMQLNRRFLSDELERLDRRGVTLEIYLMQDMLYELDSGIASAWAAQGAMQAAMGQMTMGLPDEMKGMFSMLAPDMSGQIFSMQDRRDELSREIDRLIRSDRIEEIRRGARANLNEFDRQVEMLGMHRAGAELSMESALRSMIAAMDDLNRMEQMLEAGIALMEQNLERMTMMYEVGMISTNTLSAVRHSLTQNEFQLAELRRGRQTLMSNMNYMLGLPLTQNTVIEYDRELPELPEDLEEHIQSLIPQTQTIIMSQYELDRAREARWVNTGDNRDINITASDRERALDPNRNRGRDLWSIEVTDEDEEIERIRNRIALQEAVERAEISHEQAQRTMEATILRAFNDYNNLTAQYEALEAEAVRAQEELDAVITNYELGQVTQFEIEQARMNLFRIELEKEGIITQQWLLAFRLENPDLLQ